MAAATSKICQICKQDCSKKPRTKDPQGNYFCNECFDQMKAEQALRAGAEPARVKAADPLPGLDDDAPEVPAEPALPADFWDAPAAAAATGPAAKTCAKCGTAMLPGASVCVACGHTTRSAKRARTVKAAGAAGGAVASAAGVAATVASKGALRLVLWLVAGGIAGVLGLALWIGVAMGTGYEIALLAWVIGAMVGGAIALTGRKHLNLFSGLIAAGITFFCVAGWKILLMAALSAATPEQEVDELFAGPDADRIVMREFTFQTAQEMADRGQKNVWPGGKVRPRFGHAADEEHPEVEEYPPQTQKAAKDRWAKMSQKDHDHFVAVLKEDMKSQARQAEIRSSGSADSVRSIVFLVVCTILGCGTAFKLGVGAS